MYSSSINALTFFTVLRFCGAKTQEFLQGQLTYDMRLLSEHGDHAFAACCDHRGRMIANFWVVKWHEDFLLILPTNVAEILKKHLQKYAVFSNVIITQENHFFIAEYCGASKEIQTAIYIDLPGGRYLILSEKNPFSDQVMHNENTWVKNNIGNEFAILCDKTSLLLTPQMIGLEKFDGVSFTKGCYVGQEIIARTQHLGTLKRHLHRLTVQSDETVSPGDALKNKNGEAIGVVVDVILLHDHMFDVLAVIEDRYWDK